MKKCRIGSLALGLSFVLTAACSKKEKDVPADSPAPAAVNIKAKVQETVAPTPAPLADNSEKVLTEKEALLAAKSGAKKLGKTLKEALVISMQKGGVEGAMHACAQNAPTITGAVANARLRVGRSSLRLRNPKNSDAPEWVKTWLKATGERKAAGLQGITEVVDGTAHFLKPLELGGLCLSCHGDPASQSGKMKEILSNRYPEDKAVGYEVGDLRGVLWAEYDLAPKGL